MTTTEPILALHEAVEAERRRACQASAWPAPLNFAELGQPPSRAQSVIEDAPVRPVETAAREHVRTIGLQLAVHGGMEAMRHAWNDVAEQDGRAAAWLDHAWDGLDAGNGIWCA